MTNSEAIELIKTAAAEVEWEYPMDYAAAFDMAIAAMKQQNPIKPEEFKSKLYEMFSSIWECEIDHPVFQDTVGELMAAVARLYKQAVERK